MTTNEERVDIRLELALSLLAPAKPGRAPVMPALWASMGMAAAALFLAGVVIVGPEAARPVAAATPVVRASEAAVAQPIDTGNASFSLSSSRDGLKGNVPAPVEDAVLIGGEER